MPSLAPHATLQRFAVAAITLLTALTMPQLMQNTPHASAQTSEGAVRLSPAMSTVPADSGPFTVYVVLENLSHFGQVSYDDNRDTTPDRETPSDGLAAFQFTITYDSAIVDIQSVEPGPSLDSSGRSFTCLPLAREPGSVTFGCLSPGASPAGAQGTMTLGLVQITPRANGLSPLVVSAEIAGPLGDSSQVDVSGGAVRVSGPAPASSATAKPNSPGTPASSPSSTRVAVATAPKAATARPTAGGQETPDRTATPRRTTGPGPTSQSTSTPTTNPKSDGSGRGPWLWIIAAAGAVALSGAGLTAILWRRRLQGGI